MLKPQDETLELIDHSVVLALVSWANTHLLTATNSEQWILKSPMLSNKSRHGSAYYGTWDLS